MNIGEKLNEMSSVVEATLDQNERRLRTLPKGSIIINKAKRSYLWIHYYRDEATGQAR